MNDSSGIYGIASHRRKTLDELLIAAHYDEHQKKIFRALANPNNLTYNDVAIEARTTPAAVSSFVNRRKAAYQKSKFEAGIAELIARRCGLRMGPRLLV